MGIFIAILLALGLNANSTPIVDKTAIINHLNSGSVIEGKMADAAKTQEQLEKLIADKARFEKDVREGKYPDTKVYIYRNVLSPGWYARTRAITAELRKFGITLNPYTPLDKIAEASIVNIAVLDNQLQKHEEELKRMIDSVEDPKRKNYYLHIISCYDVDSRYNKGYIIKDHTQYGSPTKDKEFGEKVVTPERAAELAAKKKKRQENKIIKDNWRQEEKIKKEEKTEERKERKEKRENKDERKKQKEERKEKIEDGNNKKKKAKLEEREKKKEERKEERKEKKKKNEE